MTVVAEMPKGLSVVFATEDWVQIRDMLNRALQTSSCRHHCMIWVLRSAVMGLVVADIIFFLYLFGTLALWAVIMFSGTLVAFAYAVAYPIFYCCLRVFGLRHQQRLAAVCRDLTQQYGHVFTVRTIDEGGVNPLPNFIIDVSRAKEQNTLRAGPGGSTEVEMG